LAGGAMQGAAGSVMLLTPSSFLHPATSNCLDEHRVEIAELKYLGGTSAISQGVRDSIETVLQ
jgi:hypothetical protein